MLRRNLPALKTEEDEHFADILTGLYKQQMRVISGEQKTNQKRATRSEAHKTQGNKTVTPYAAAVKAESGDETNKDPAEVKVAAGVARDDGVNGQIDKTNLPISTPRRIRDKEHLRYVASQPCIICGRSPGQAHHLRFAQPSALGRKVSDEWTVPLCATHHRSLHSVGDEERWWKEKGIDATAHAVRLWWKTQHPRPEWAT